VKNEMKKIELKVFHVHQDSEKNVECEAIDNVEEGFVFCCPQCQTEIVVTLTKNE